MFSRLVQQANLDNIEFIVWTFYRSPADQNYLYQQGRTRPGGIITNCDGYINKSKHQEWLAIDILIVRYGTDLWTHEPEYDRLGEIWEALGGTWGGKFHSPQADIFHFELEGE
jgi:hypothetical protein